MTEEQLQDRFSAMHELHELAALERKWNEACRKKNWMWRALLTAEAAEDDAKTVFDKKRLQVEALLELGMATHRQAVAEADKTEREMRSCHGCSAPIGESGVVDSETGDSCAKCYLANEEVPQPAEPEPETAVEMEPALPALPIGPWLQKPLVSPATLQAEIDAAPAPARLPPEPLPYSPPVPRIKPTLAPPFKASPPLTFTAAIGKVCTVPNGRVALATILREVAHLGLSESSIKVYLRRLVTSGHLQQIGPGHFAHKDWRR